MTPRTLPGGPEGHIYGMKCTHCGWGTSPLEDEVVTPAKVRQAKLRPGRAELYPTLPARMWTPAACVTQLVASYRHAQPHRPGTSEKARTLPETDFEFRGGLRRRLGGWFARTRTGEPWGTPTISLAPQ